MRPWGCVAGVAEHVLGQFDADAPVGVRVSGVKVDRPVRWSGHGQIGVGSRVVRAAATDETPGLLETFAARWPEKRITSRRGECSRYGPPGRDTRNSSSMSLRRRSRGTGPYTSGRSSWRNAEHQRSALNPSR